MDTIFNSLKKAKVKLFCLKPQILLGDKVSKNSFGISYVPPFYIRNLQIWAQTGQPVKIHGKLLDYWFNTYPEHKLTDRVIRDVSEIITDLQFQPGSPEVCVFLPRFAILKLMGIMGEDSDFSYWPGVTVSETTRLYEFYFDEESRVQSKLINHKSLFCST